MCIWLLDWAIPATRYARTRHNVGFMIVDRVADILSPRSGKKSSRVCGAKARLDAEQVLLIKPQTFMNLSGRLVQQWISYYQDPLELTMIVHDDLDLDLGIIKFGHGGGAGGHKGVESIVRELGVRIIPRLKIGIGRPAIWGTDRGFRP